MWFRTVRCTQNSQHVALSGALAHLSQPVLVEKEGAKGIRDGRGSAILFSQPVGQRILLQGLVAAVALPRAAMSTMLRLVAACLLLSLARAATRTRYLSVEEVEWDYTPVRENLCLGAPLTEAEALWVLPGPGAVGSVYTKAVFREYADEQFQNPLEYAEHLGTLGPLVHVEVGDLLRVVLRHNAEGMQEVNFAPDHVAPREGSAKEIKFGEVGVWEFDVTVDSGPVDDAYASSVMHYYSSSVDKTGALYAGLLGPLIVTRKGEADADGKPADVEDELVTVLFVSDENASPYAEVNNARALEEDKKGEKVQIDEDSNQMHSINGFMFCNLKGLDMALGVKTRWYGAAVGNEADLHSLHWHGNVAMTSDGLHTDSVRLLSHSVYPVTFTPTNPGIHLVHCHVAKHQNGGMLALYHVSGDSVVSGLESGAPTRMRNYYVQAEDVVWDYTPRGENVCDGVDFGDDEAIFVEEAFPIEEGDDVVGYGMGSKYLKTRYVQYTDKTFETKVERDSADTYLGIMGPVLRIRVGEAMMIHFRNNASAELSIHTHGLFYAKDSEGAPYNDGTSGKDKLDDIVAPGDEVDMLWVCATEKILPPQEMRISCLLNVII